MVATPESTLTGHRSCVNGVAVFPDCSRIVSGSDDMSVKVWDANTGLELFELTGYSNSVICVAVFSDCSRIVTGSFDNSVKVWDAKTGLELFELTGHSYYVRGVDVFWDGSHIVSGSLDGSVKIWGMVYYPAKSVFILLMKLPLNEDVAKIIMKYCKTPKEELEWIWKQKKWYSLSVLYKRILFRCVEYKSI